jgi:hypothetical protein
MPTFATERAHAGGGLRRGCTYDRLLPALLFIALFVAAALMPIQHDTWWQLRAGHDMWATRRVLLIDTYSHTAYGAFWPNHEWLAEVFYYACYRVGGLALVTLFAATLIAIAWSITWRLTTGSLRLRFALTALALVPASLHWEPRPHAFSFLFLMLTVYLIVRERYAWLPLVFLIWANCHGGVLTGFLVLTTGLSVQMLWSRDGWLRRSTTLAACAIAGTATPLGLALWSELPKSLARIRMYPLNEWQPATFTDPRLAPFWLIAALLCVCVVRRLIHARAEKWSKPQSMSAVTMTACALVLLPLAISAVRNVGLFLMIAVPAITALAPADAASPASRRERTWLNLTIISAATAASIAAIVYAYVMQIDHLRWTPLPAGSLRALARCPGNLYNRYDEGGYLIWFAPEKPVFLDGRQDPYEPRLILEQIRIESTGDYAGAFSQYHIGCAYLPTSSPVAARLATAGWRSLYRDPNWVVLAR